MQSSLVHAILRELPLSGGSVETNGRIAYASQDPWLYTGSVRENVLFGLPYRHDWYMEVIEACSMKRDIALFPYGDKTLVGEKGMSLSGGQKARINLARAVYADADIVLLDDPLSAVDARVGRHIFDKCIRGLLLHKCVILVTHQVQFLQPASQILVLRNGQVESQGTFAELAASNDLSLVGVSQEAPSFAIDDHAAEFPEAVTSLQGIEDSSKFQKTVVVLVLYKKFNNSSMKI